MGEPLPYSFPFQRNVPGTPQTGMQLGQKALSQPAEKLEAKTSTGLGTQFGINCGLDQEETADNRGVLIMMSRGTSAFWSSEGFANELPLLSPQGTGELSFLRTLETPDSQVGN